MSNPFSERCGKITRRGTLCRIRKDNRNDLWCQFHGNQEIFRNESRSSESSESEDTFITSESESESDSNSSEEELVSVEQLDDKPISNRLRKRSREDGSLSETVEHAPAKKPRVIDLSCNEVISVEDEPPKSSSRIVIDLTD
jgi:hypothetical protein